MENMAKESCFFCKRELGWGKAKHKNSELLEKGIEPDGMSHEDICCDHCFNARKNAGVEQKQQGAEPGTALNQQRRQLASRVGDYKPLWDKNGTIQFKNEQIAILKRAIGAQVEFIIAFDDLTKEGYRLMVIDEGKETGVGGLGGGISSYFYFQKRELV